jgi:hypothetical protein
MKVILSSLILLIIFTTFSFAQYPRHGILPKYSNGLIYSDSTIKKLRKIADSLNYQFTLIQDESTFMSYSYAQARYVKIDAKKVENRNEIFTDKMSFDDLIKNYPVLEINRNTWLYKEDNSKKHHQADFNDYVSKSWHRYPTDKWALIETRNWAVHREGWTYMPFQNYEALEMEASYTTSPFIQKEIPQKYAKMIQYADFLVGEKLDVVFPSEKNNILDSTLKSKIKKDTLNRAVSLFFSLISGYPNRPTIDSCNRIKFDDYDSTKEFARSKKWNKCFYDYWQRLQNWDSLRIEYIRKSLSKTAKFKKLLDDAIEETISTKISDEGIEFYIAEFKSKQLALQLSLNRKDDMGFDNFSTQHCDHAKQILQLAAETANWRIFMDKHLRVLNDNFEPECSHVKKGEFMRTYIKELEEIGVNVIDLLLGASLRVSNPYKNHPYLDSRAVSRALSELKDKDKDKVENTLLSMIEDQELDDFNRMIICLLFKNYNCLLKDSKRQEENQKKYFKALSTLPGTLGDNLNKFDVPELFYWFN